MTGRWNGERVGSHDGWLLYVGGDGKRVPGKVHVVWGPEAEIQAILNLALAVCAKHPRIPYLTLLDLSTAQSHHVGLMRTDKKNYCSNTVENEKTPR